MKKLSFLLSTLGGALAGYVFSNASLREQLANASTPEHAAKILGKHLQRDGKKLGDHVRTFLQSTEVKHHVHKAKAFVEEQVGMVKHGVGEYIAHKKVRAKKTARKAVKRVKNVVKRFEGGKNIS